MCRGPKACDYRRREQPLYRARRVPPSVALYERLECLQSLASGPPTARSRGLARAKTAAGGRARPSERPAFFVTMMRLWPYLWPSDRFDLKLRVVACLLLDGDLEARHHRRALHLQMDDRRAGPGRQGRERSPTRFSASRSRGPLALTALYGVIRILMVVLTQMREGLFARVALHAVRRLACAPSSTCIACRCASISSARPAG